MHILFINPHLTRHDTEAGTWGRQLVEELRSAEEVVTTFPEYSEKCYPAANVSRGSVGRIKRIVKRRLPDRWESSVIEVLLFVRAARNMARFCWMAWRKRRELSPDVVYARAFEFDWTPRLVSSILKCPFILEIHTPLHVDRRFRGRGDSQLLRWFDKALWQSAAYLRVVPKPVVKLVEDTGINPDRIRFIPYGVGTDQSVNREARVSGDTVQLIFVGSFYPWHGAELLLKAFAMAQAQAGNLRLCLVGDGLTRAACEKEVQGLGIQDSVKFTGWLPRERVTQYLNESDIGIAPFPKIEPFYFDSAKILEYMAAGLAIISSEIERISEILGHGQGGLLVPPGDVPALADSIVKLAENAPLRHQLGMAARRIVEREYSRDIITQQVISLCNEAMSPR